MWGKKPAFSRKCSGFLWIWFRRTTSLTTIHNKQRPFGQVSSAFSTAAETRMQKTNLKVLCKIKWLKLGSSLNYNFSFLFWIFRSSCVYATFSSSIFEMRCRTSFEFLTIHAETWNPFLLHCFWPGSATKTRFLLPVTQLSSTFHEKFQIWNGPFLCRVSSLSRERAFHLVRQ